MLSLRLEASASVYDWVDPTLESEPFGRGGAAILIDMTILVCTQIETWAPGPPWPNWTYEIRHYDQHLNLLGMVSTGPLPFESYHCYFVPCGGTNALLMLSNGDSSKTYRTAFVSASGAVPTIGTFTSHTSAIASGYWYWGRNPSRCQFIDEWSVIVLANGMRGIHVLDSGGNELTTLTHATENIGETLSWNMRDNDLYLTTYSQTSGFQLSEWRLSRVTFSSYTLTKIGDFMPEGPTGASSFRLWGLALGGTSAEARPISWYGEYFADPGGGFSNKFRWFKTADAVTGAILNTQDMTIIGNMDTGYASAVALYPVENFYSAVNSKVGETYFAGQLGGDQDNSLNGVAGLYPSFAIHVIGIDSVTGEQRYVPLPIPGVHGEQDTLSDGSVTFSIRNHRWVATCCTVNLDDFSGHDFYSFSVWTGSTHSLAMWEGSDWRIIGDKTDTEPGRLRMATSDAGDQWVEEVRGSEDVGPTAVVPLSTTAGSFAAPWFATSASGYPQYSGWVAESTLSAFLTKVGASPYVDIADAASNYVAVSQATDGVGNTIWVSTYWAPFTPAGDVISAYVEFQVRGNGGSGDATVRWGISGNQYYFSNYNTGTEPATKLAPNVWRTHRMSLLDPRFSTRTKTKFLADLTAGNLNAGVNMDRAFDVSAIRLVVQYAETVTRPLKMWMPDAVGTFAGWVEVARMRPMP